MYPGVAIGEYEGRVLERLESCGLARYYSKLKRAGYGDSRKFPAAPA
jgi:hypothetical protein